MTFQEFLASPNGNILLQPLTTAYPNCMKFLQAKYKNYECLYASDIMVNQLASLFLEYSNILSNIEDALKIRETNKNTIDNLGETNKRLKEVVYTSEGSDTTNYVGYEVVGEYEKKNDTLSTNNNTNDKWNTYNFLSAITRLEVEGKKLGWNKFEKQFIKLFITIYPVIL